MTAKMIATRAYPTSPTAKKYAQKTASQQGVTLVELMVGLAIGLLVVAASMVALMASRGISGTVSDASGLQQQAAYAFRAIGTQMRQAGSLYLNPDPAGQGLSLDPTTPVAFETEVPGISGAKGFDPQNDTLRYDSSTQTLSIGYRRYPDQVFTNTTPQSQVRNCLGGPQESNKDMVVESNFRLVGTDLQCGGNGAAAQPIIGNVAEMQVRYIIQNTNVADNPTIQYSSSFTPSNANQVQGIEVCLVLYGTEAIDMPSGSTYRNCADTADVDMSTLTGARAKRMHMVFRSTYQLRSQGLLPST